MTYKAYSDMDEDGAVKRTGILPEDMMPPAVSPASGTYLIYNPGTEITDTVIRVSGKAPNGLKITNQTTGDICEIVSLPSSLTLTVDSEHGFVCTSAAPDTAAFEYHDLGYIRLAPCIPYERDVMVNYTSGKNEITFSTHFPVEENVGQYIYVGGEWLRITSVNKNKATVNKNLAVSGFEETMIATLNEIVVEGNGLALTTLEIDYEPRIR